MANAAEELGLARALAVVGAVTTRAASVGASVAAVVIDGSGETVVVHRMDGVYPSAAAIALKKAFGALNFRAPTHVAAQTYPAQTQLNLVLAEPRITFLGGGVPVLLGGRVAGALGVSGGTGEQDLACCEAGLAALQSAT